MTCKLNGLFSIGEDFDDEELLGTDWAAASASGPADVAAAVSSCALRASSVAHREPEKIGPGRAGERSAAPCNGSASRSSMHTAAGQTVALGLRQLSSSSSYPRPPAPNGEGPHLAPQQSGALANRPPPVPCAAQDDFDDWDVDLADLDECDGQTGRPPPSPAGPAVGASSPASSLRPPTRAGVPALPDRTQKELRAPCSATASSSGCRFPPRTFSAPHLQSPNPRPPGVFPGPAAAAASSSPAPRTLYGPREPQKTRTGAQPSPQARGLFETVSSAPSPSAGSSARGPHPLHTPVLTNRLVQLVSASSRLPRKRPRSEPRQPRTRRFPGPAGLLPEQPQDQNLDQVVVSAPQTPAHGAAARLPSQGSSSQTDEDDFGGGGAWAAMKAEMGLDERTPSCFLHSYSVVMVLRKAALKQLARNKVPNMAVLLKSIIHTHADAKAVFKDPTGEIQGTVHRRLLEDRAEELKVGAVLLLKQVGVFSPSHRNHYLNVTSNNLLRIYAPDGASRCSQLPPLVLEPVLPSPARTPSVPRGPVSRMQLVFDEDDDDGQRQRRRIRDPPPNARVVSSRGPPEPTGRLAAPLSDWDADDDLDELLGELTEESYCL